MGKKRKKKTKLKLFRTNKATSPQRSVKNKPKLSRSRKSKKKKNKAFVKKKKIPRKKKNEKRRRRIAFRKRMRVPGGGDVVTVSTPDLTRGIQISYHGKSYKLSLSQFFSYLNRKKSRVN